MQTEEASYVHGPVDGLPKSLVKPKEGEAAVIVLMRSKAGLNRKRVRELRAKFKPRNDRAEALSKSMFADDWQLLARYVSADHRWGSFWNCMLSQQQKRSIVGSVHFTLALDIQLLNAYDPSWMTLEEDAETLTGCCPEWPRIHEALLKYWKGGKTPMPLGVFMLWPQLQTDLHKWSSLDAARQLEVPKTNLDSERSLSDGASTRPATVMMRVMGETCPRSAPPVSSLPHFLASTSIQRATDSSTRTVQPFSLVPGKTTVGSNSSRCQVMPTPVLSSIP